MLPGEKKITILTSTQVCHTTRGVVLLRVHFISDGRAIHRISHPSHDAKQKIVCGEYQRGAKVAKNKRRHVHGELRSFNGAPASAAERG